MRAFFVLALSAFILFAAGSAWLALYPAVPPDLGGVPDLDAAATRVRIPVDGADALSGWLLSGRRPGVIVLFAGYARDHHREWRYAQALRRDGWTLLAVDFRSARAQRRKPTTLGYWELRDARATLDWVRSQPRLAAQPLALFGESLGGSVALALAAERPEVAAVAADCPFASAAAALHDAFPLVAHLPAWPLAPLARAFGALATGHAPDSLDVAGAVRARGDKPLLLIQSDAEDRFSRQQVAVLAAAAPPHAQTWLLHDCGHNQAWNTHRAEYERRLREFYLGALAPPAPVRSPVHAPARTRATRRHTERIA